MQEKVFLVHISIEHSHNLCDVAISLDKVADEATELITLLGVLVVIAICNRLQCTCHLAHSHSVLNTMLIPNSNKRFYILICVDCVVQQPLFCLVDKVNIDFLFKECLLIKWLERIEDIFLCVGEIKNKCICLSSTSAV